MMAVKSNRQRCWTRLSYWICKKMHSTGGRSSLLSLGRLRIHSTRQCSLPIAARRQHSTNLWTAQNVPCVVSQYRIQMVRKNERQSHFVTSKVTRKRTVTPRLRRVCSRSKAVGSTTMRPSLGYSPRRLSGYVYLSGLVPRLSTMSNMAVAL